MFWLVGIALRVIGLADRNSAGPARDLVVGQCALVPRLAKTAKVTCSVDNARFEVLSCKRDAR